MSSEFFLEILTPEKVFLSEKVQSFSFMALDGRLEIQKGFLPSIISVVAGRLSIKRNGEWIDAACADGFIVVGKEKVSMFVQTAEWAHEIDLMRAKRDAELAKEQLRLKQNKLAYRMLEAKLARAIARLGVLRRKGE